jgi:hypothetical protein
MRDRAAKRRLRRPLCVNVNELVIAAQVGEGVDPIPCHLEPLADANLLADVPLQPRQYS